MPESRNRVYKELTLHQLRSFCETARRGSFAAAAEALEVRHPTVLQQVHALERDFGVKLVEPHERGCRLTEAGRLLVEIAGPAVESIVSLREQFRAALAGIGYDLTIAMTPRIVLEDLAPLVAEFRERSPDTRFTFLEMDDGEVAYAIAARRADFGFTPATLTDDLQLVLAAETGYFVEIRLVAPADHPLARRRTILPRDLAEYPFVNAPGTFSGPGVQVTLDRLDVPTSVRHQARAVFASSIRRLVQLGFGIALLPAAASMPAQPGFLERSMSKHFGHVPIRLVRRRGGVLPAAAEEFIRFVREMLGSPLAGGE
jgi:DNA-binding transcriptional LysR family regulator